MDKSRQVELCGRERLNGELSFTTQPPWQLSLQIGERHYGAEAEDLFVCLQAVRTELEAEQLMICINGARENVWPSGMSRDMGGGLLAYEMFYSRRSGRDDLVKIFDPAPCEQIVTVAHQQAWVDEYFASVRYLPPPWATEVAAQHPNGLVYQTDGDFAPGEAVPPEAIVGSWPVGPDGIINGPFVPNPNHRSSSSEDAAE